MVLEKRQCPNCGSNEVLERDGAFVCMNCRSFFDKPQDVTFTHIEWDEAEIERIKSKERLELNRRKIEEKRRKEKLDMKVALWCIIIIFILFIFTGGARFFR